MIKKRLSRLICDAWILTEINDWLIVVLYQVNYWYLKICYG